MCDDIEKKHPRLFYFDDGVRMVNKRAFGWAWLCDFGLCHWAEPDRKRLMERGKPSPEAKIVRVELVPVKRKRRT